MKKLLALIAAILASSPAIGGPNLPKPVVDGLRQPQACPVGLGGKVFVAVAGETGKSATGAVLVVENGKALPFAEGLNDPRGLIAFQKWLFVADRDRVLRID